MSAVLEAVSLTKRFTVRRPLFGAPVELAAVDGVSLAVRRGETLAVVGESGCGKSTLARLLVRLLEPTAGTVLHDGRDVATLPAAELRALRRRLQFVFQDPFSSLNPRMKVGALIEEPMAAHSIGSRAERRERAAALLARVGLPPEAAGRHPHEFSGGQRQRIGIARALATGPEVVVADEPVSALDVSIQAQVVNILEDLKRDLGLTLVIVAHDLAVIRHMADRVAVMYLGEIVETAPAADLFARPRHPYAEALMAAIPIPVVGARRAEAHAAGEPPSPLAPPSGCRFHPRCPHAVERCRTERPERRAMGAGDVACHRAEALTLAGLDAPDDARAPAARARLDLWRKATARPLEETEGRSA